MIQFFKIFATFWLNNKSSTTLYKILRILSCTIFILWDILAYVVIFLSLLSSLASFLIIFQLFDNIAKVLPLHTKFLEFEAATFLLLKFFGLCCYFLSLLSKWSIFMGFAVFWLNSKSFATSIKILRIWSCTYLFFEMFWFYTVEINWLICKS